MEVVDEAGAAAAIMATTTTAIVATAKAEGTTAAVEVVEVETTTDHPVTEDEMEETVEGTATVEAVDTAAIGAD